MRRPPLTFFSHSFIFHLVPVVSEPGGFGFGVAGNPPGPQYPFGNLRLSPDTAFEDDIWLDFQHYGIRSLQLGIACSSVVITTP
jgi:hypothetical protein